jgi:hypothetical protein
MLQRIIHHHRFHALHLFLDMVDCHHTVRTHEYSDRTGT